MLEVNKTGRKERFSASKTETEISMEYSSLQFYLLLLFVTIIYVSPNENQDSHILIRARPSNDEQLQFLKSMLKMPSKFGVDFWTESLKLSFPVDIMVESGRFEEFKANFDKVGLKYNVTMENVRKIIETQSKKHRIKNLIGKFAQRDDASSGFRIDRYNSYMQIVEYLKRLQDTFPDIVLTFAIGNSYENRPLQVIKIGRNTGIAKKSVWIDAGIHAREWISPATALYIINELVTKYSSDNEIRKYVDTLDWHIMPVLNADGYEYSRTSTVTRVRLWRKNRKPDPFCQRQSNCCDGVDLNRNFDFSWGQAGSSNYQCEDQYSGLHAFSEPETAAVRDYLTPRAASFGAFITLHSYSQIFIYPFGHAIKSYPVDVADLHKVAVKAKNAILASSSNKTRYIVGTGADTLYPASGGSVDWAKHALGIKYSYLLELRPSESGINGFLLDEAEISPTGRETFDGLKVVADAVLAMDPPSASPVARNPLQPDMITEFVTNCFNEHERCSWYASLGFCFNKPDVQESCRLACRICDQ
uniref:Peptidase M14 carboxypeptidase A domain-containing protein n=1 Tax=Romanomermis culicivorax TaxID=13658 RepID=A0A915JAT4_ROMCU